MLNKLPTKQNNLEYHQSAEDLMNDGPFLRISSAKVIVLAMKQKEKNDHYGKQKYNFLFRSDD